MFRAFAKVVPARDIFMFHPLDLMALLELAWDRRLNETARPLGHPFHRSDLNRFKDTWFGKNAQTPPPPETPSGGPLQPNIRPLQKALDAFGDGFDRRILSDQLMYAFMIESTGIVPVFRRVIEEMAHGEKLGVPSADAQHWLRNTEELFYRMPAAFFVPAFDSDVRPDRQATRLNVYQRMFDMIPPQAPGGAKASPFVRAEAANQTFVKDFEDFLRETQVGIANVANTSGANPTDDAKLADLAKRLHDMLLARRSRGALSREEFVFVSMMSWCQLTVETQDAPILADLKVNASGSAEQNLFQIAQMVGVPAHGLAGSYFAIADAISRILLLIETGVFVEIPASVRALYLPGDVSNAMRTIITHWTAITGRDIKAGKVVAA
jgi:hypothetical protein